MGTFFGSFFTLAVYRIPKKEDIFLKHSYCPNCNHKLGFFDLFPVISYLALKGHCRYCNNKIRVRYFILEIVSGISFVLIGWSLKFNIYNIDSMIQTIFMILYISILYIIAGIDKESIKIQMNVLFVGVGFSLCYIIYQCTLPIHNVYLYVMYFALLLVLIYINQKIIKQEKNKYYISIMMLCLLMFVFSEVNNFLLSLALCFILILGKLFLRGKSSNKIPIGFYLILSNILIILLSNIVINYFI